MSSIGICQEYKYRKSPVFWKIYIVNFHNRKRNFKNIETESRVNSKIV